MLQKTSNRKIGTREIAASSLLGALSALWEIIPGPPFDVPFPPYPKATWDITGVPMMIALLFYGPLCAVYTCFIGCSIIFFRGNVYGGTLKLIAELATIIGYALLRRNFLVDTAKATLSRVAVMTVANYYLLPIFYGKYGTTPEAAAALLAPLAIFNFTQALINIIPAYIIYQRIKSPQKT
jgi:riboflavin transporter FmnP